MHEDLGDVSELLGAGRFAEARWVAETGSTNADLVARASMQPDVATVLIADHQTAGRGRRDRRWEMRSEGGLLLSFFVPWTNLATAHAVATALGVAACDAVRANVSHELVGLKWPNDLVSRNSAKVAGMLSEVVMLDGTFRGVVTGIGINVSWPSPTDIAENDALANAESMNTLAGKPVDRHDLAKDLIRRFDETIERVERLGPRVVYDRYRDRCLTLGQSVQVELSTGSFVGRALTVDDDGALHVESDGQIRVVEVGDVVHLRPEHRPE